MKRWPCWCTGACGNWTFFLCKNFLFSLACVSSETPNLQAVFVVFMTRKGVVVTGFPSGDRGNWEWKSLRDWSHACFANKALKRLNLELFRNVSVFGTSECYWVLEKTKLRLSGGVNFHCMQMVLWWARGLFSTMIEMTCHVNHFFDLWQWCNFSGIEALKFFCIYTRV